MNESPLTSSLLTPMLALICWSLIMLVWLYATRIPAMGKAKVNPATAQEPSALDALPLAVRQVGYNYNHLMEQPTIFYALVVYSYLAGQQNGPNLILAWLYVALRILHSLVQATVNLVLVRFGIFALASVVLGVLAGRDVWALFQAA
jgi:hypothetical protein